MQIYVVLLAFSVFGWSLALIPNEPCKLDPWTGGKITNPAAKLRLNANGIDLASALSTENVTNFLKTLQAPDIKILDLTNYGIRVSDFQPPNYFRKLVRPNTLRWGFDQGQLAISGGLRQAVRALPVPGVSKDEQTLEANITVASGSISMETVSSMVKDVDNRPTLYTVSCTATLGILNVTVTGNTVLASISDTVKLMIIDQIQRTFQQLLCASTVSVMKDKINNILQTYLSKTKLDDNNLILDYGLTENPKVVSNDQAVEGCDLFSLSIRLSVLPAEHGGLRQCPTHAGLLHDGLRAQHFALYGEQRKNASFRSQRQNIVDKVGELSRVDLYDYVQRKHLRRQNLSESFDARRRRCVHQSVDTIPGFAKGDFRRRRRLVGGSGDDEVGPVDNKNKRTKLFSAISTCIYGSLTPKLANSTLYAIVNITSMPFNSFGSPMNDVSSGDLKNLRTIFTTIFEEVFNGIARIGSPLPLIDGVSLVNPSLQLSPRTFYVASNFTYKLPDGFKASKGR